MLQEIRIKNFRNIKDEVITLDYGPKRAPAGYAKGRSIAFLDSGTKPLKRVVPIMALYGRGAVGKTTILKACLRLQEIVTETFNAKFYEPNKLASSPYGSEAGSSFGLSFIRNRKLFEYNVSLSSTGIESESLHVDGELKFEMKKAQITFLAEAHEKHRKAVEEIFSLCGVRKNEGCQVRSFLQTVAEQLRGLDAELNLAHEYLADTLNPYLPERLSLGDTFNELCDSLEGTYAEKRAEAVKLLLGVCEVLGLEIKYLEPEDVSEYGRIEKILKEEFGLNASVGFKRTRFDVVRESEGGELASFDFEKEEPQSTQKALALAALISAAILKGRVLMVDDLDVSLHPGAAEKLISLFKDGSVNTNGSQLVFTALSPDILTRNFLKPWEIGVMCPTASGCRKFRKASDVPGKCRL